jgi:hypothetical protein
VLGTGFEVNRLEFHELMARSRVPCLKFKVQGAERSRN